MPIPAEVVHLNSHVHHFSYCRVCAGNRLRLILHLADMPLTDDFVPQSMFGSEFRCDLNLYVCEDCATVQTRHDVSGQEYYKDYRYSVAGSATASRFMRLLAESVVRRCGTADPARRRILEIGSGDGSQLLAFKQLGWQVLGYEPSAILAQSAEQRGVPTIRGHFDLSFKPELPNDFHTVDVLLLSYTFDHLAHPREFLAAARSLLRPDSGILVVEVHNLEDIFKRREYCLFEHEHTIYLTAASAASLAAREGFKVLDYDPVPGNERRANSLIFVATPQGADQSRPAVLPLEPAKAGFYERQAALIQQGIANLDCFVDHIAASGGTIAGYGAGGRGVMTLASMQSAAKVSYLVDRRFDRPGLVAPKSGVPVSGLSKLKESPVDKILVFSYGYMDEIRSELAAYGYKPDQFHSLIDVMAGTAG